MVVVGFDTATDDTTVCAARDGEIAHEVQRGPDAGGRPRHATSLLEEVERSASAAGGWDAVDLIAVGVGPGSFTGLRIGIATAQGLCAGLGLPISGVCTLDALGRGIRETGEGLALAVLDARRGEVFVALYAVDGSRLWEPSAMAPAELAVRIAELSHPILAAGSGAVRFRDELVGGGIEIPGDADPVHRVAARHVCALAADARDGEAAGPVAPIYLRPPDAERWRERDTFQRTE
ncbi:MAG TPA: tRNA (adenosine(37)-N6)-threonylcarbamoyltransferase complex dimerization subunit type 1 TsaB [Solirubrobacterales bacterium]